MNTIALRGYWTYQDLMRLFHRSYMTIYLWKTKRGLPHLQVSPKRVLFPKQPVVEWAQTQGLPLRFDESYSDAKPRSPILPRSGELKSSDLPSSA